MALKVVAQRAPARTVTKTVPFDYSKYLANEPTLQGTLEQLRQSRLTQGAQLVGDEQQLYGQLGEAPDLSQPQFANLSPELRDALSQAVTPELQGIISNANQAGVSTLAQKAHDYALGQAAIGSAYGGRGGLSGGEGVHMNEALRQYGLDQYNARQAALTALGGLQQTYLTGQQDLANQAGAAVSAAQQRAGQLIDLGQLGPTSTSVTTTNPYLNPAAPKQVSTRVSTAAGPQYEPKPTGQGYQGVGAAPTAPAAPKPPQLAAPYRLPSSAVTARSL